jgi:hypothetical protein
MLWLDVAQLVYLIFPLKPTAVPDHMLSLVSTNDNPPSQSSIPVNLQSTLPLSVPIPPNNPPSTFVSAASANDSNPETKSNARIPFSRIITSEAILNAVKAQVRKKEKKEEEKLPQNPPKKKRKAAPLNPVSSVMAWLDSFPVF